MHVTTTSRPQMCCWRYEINCEKPFNRHITFRDLLAAVLIETILVLWFTIMRMIEVSQPDIGFDGRLWLFKFVCK